MYLLPDLAADWRTADGADQSAVCDTLLELLSLSARMARSQFGRQLLSRALLIVDQWNICRGLNRRITAAASLKFPPCVAASGTALRAAGSTSPRRPRRINTYRTEWSFAIIHAKWIPTLPAVIRSRCCSWRTDKKKRDYWYTVGARLPACRLKWWRELADIVLSLCLTGSHVSRHGGVWRHRGDGVADGGGECACVSEGVYVRRIGDGLQLPTSDGRADRHTVNDTSAVSYSTLVAL